MLELAREALEDLARATGIAFSATPTVGAISLFSDHNHNVYAMIVTGMTAAGEVDRGVTPYGDPPMTAREFTLAAALAEAAVYALYLPEHREHIDVSTQAAAQRSMAEAQKEQDPTRKVLHLLRALTEEVGCPPLRIREDQLGLMSIEEPSPFGCATMTVQQMDAALMFAHNAIYHHRRTREQASAAE